MLITNMHGLTNVRNVLHKSHLKGANLYLNKNRNGAKELHLLIRGIHKGYKLYAYKI